MQANFTLKLNHMLRRSIISCTMVGIGVLAVASTGGGGKNSSAAKSSLASLRSSSGYTLKAGPGYQPNRLCATSNPYNFGNKDAVVTYRKGNTFYILPVSNKQLKAAGMRSNLNLVNWKVKLHK